MISVLSWQARRPLNSLVPDLSVAVDTSLVVTIEDIVGPANDEAERLLLELEGNAILDPVLGVCGERQPAVEVDVGIVEFQLKSLANGARSMSHYPRIALKTSDILVGIRQPQDTTVPALLHGLHQVVRIVLLVPKRFESADLAVRAGLGVVRVLDAKDVVVGVKQLIHAADDLLGGREEGQVDDRRDRWRG
jgi:hypothetical protein